MTTPAEKLLTPDRCDALFATDEGKRVLDAAVAEAMGWRRYEPGGHPDATFWRRGDDIYREGINERTADPPPYASAAADAPDRWRWWGEMIEALVECAWAFGHSPDFGEWFGREGDNIVSSPSIARALIKALAAAGKIKEPENG